MRFFETILFAAGLVAAVTIDNYPTSGVVAGQTYTIKYSPADGGPTTFLLRQGESTDLTTIDTLTTTATGGSFQWTPSTDLVNEPDYALQVFQGSDNNYSGLFSLSGGAEESTSSSSAAYSASTPASSAASSAASAASSAISSIESSVSSVLASITSVAASASITSSAGLNSTVTSATLSKSASASATTTTKLPEVSTAAGNSLAQPMAAMLGAAAAFAYLA